MKVFALVGGSGTGKSHKALLIAHRENIEYIIDDGLLINKNRILAGLSAKKELNKIQAIRRAIFFDKEHAQAVRDALKREKPKSIMILGTSVGMVEKIIESLELPPVSRTFNIEDVSSDKEIQLARTSRTKNGTHIIPLPGIEIQRKFPINLVESLEIFYRKRYSNRKIGERTVVRPPFSYFGNCIFRKMLFWISSFLILKILKTLSGLEKQRLI